MLPSTSLIRAISSSENSCTMQKKLSERQTKYREHMSEHWSELERGVSTMESHRKHIPVWQYKKAQWLDKQAEKIKTALADINVFNAGKKRDEALEALADWLPQAERFTALTKNTQNYIDQLSDTNSCAEAERKGGEVLRVEYGGGLYAACVEVVAEVN